MESSHHKVNPGMLVTPTHAGGIKLAAVSVTSKTHRTKHVVAWLTRKPGQYFAACLSGQFKARCNTSASTSGLFSGVASPHTLTRTGAQARAERTAHPNYKPTKQVDCVEQHSFDGFTRSCRQLMERERVGAVVH